MNSMVGAYHSTKSSVSSETGAERKRSKRKSRPSADVSEPSSTLGDTPLTECPDPFTADDERNKVEENVTVTEWEHSLIEPVAGSHQKTSAEDLTSFTETKHILETKDMVLDHDSASDVLIVSDSKKSVDDQIMDSEQKHTDQNDKKLFSLPRPSETELNEKLLLEPVVASSSDEPGWVKVDYKAERLKDSTEHTSPFSKLVNLRELNEALCSEKVLVSYDKGPLSEDLLQQYIKKKDDKLLKIAIRQNNWGADLEIRGLLWQLLCKHCHKAHEDDTYDDFAEDIFGQGSDSDHIQLPSFIDFMHLETYSLSTEGLIHAKKICCVIEHTNPDITYCPLLFPLVSLFLHYLDPPSCYNCVYSLLRQKEDAFIPQTKVTYEASRFVMRDLAKKYARPCYSHLLRNCASFDTLFDSWIWWIFCDLPFPYLVRVIDCFITEGMKVFYRVVLAILTLYAKYHAKKSSKPVPDIVAHLRQFCSELPVSVDKLLKMGFSIKGLSRKDIKKLLVKHTMYIKSVNKVHHHDEKNGGGLRVPMSRSFSGPILLQSLHSSVLTPDMLYAIWTWLPTRYAVCQPLLLYTSEEHGTSLVTLYSRVENYQPTIIVIKNCEDEIFGAFCSSYWRERKQSTKNLSYFGTGETFVFTLAPEKKKYDWVGLKEENIPNTANMFQAGDRHVLTVGGGHGEAILLDENLLHCRTEHCDTFGNEPLCVKKDFSCKVVEVYGFQ